MQRIIPWLCVTALLTMSVGKTATAQRSWDGGNGTFIWSDLGNWNPDGTPSGEPIMIGDLAAAANDTTLVNQNFAIDSLTVSNGADVDTEGNELQVNGLTTIGGAGVNIFVDPRSTGDMDGLDSQGIIVNSGANLQLLGVSGSTAGGIVELESGLFEINSGGDAGGHGTIELIGATVGQALENSGRLFVSSRPGTIFGVLPGTLTITNDDGGSSALGTGTIDLDGDNEAGVVDVDDAGAIFTTSLSLVIDVPIDDTFNSQMDIGTNDSVNITNAWSMGLGSILNFNGAGTHTLSGGTLTINGSTAQLNLNAGTTILNNNLTVTDGNFVLDGGATVQFEGTTTFADGTDFVNSNVATTSIVVNSSVTIGNATVDAGEDFNWDGGGFADNSTVVNATGDLNINVENIDLAGDSYGGTLTMNSGNVDVQVADGSWLMVRTININNTASDVPLLSGDILEIGNDAGAADSHLNVGGTGVSRISAPLVFKSDAAVNIVPGAILRTGTVTFDSVNGGNNASFTGGGEWRLAGLNTVSETTTINMTGGTVDLDNSSFNELLLAANDTIVNAPFTINAATMASYGEFKSFLGDTFSELTVDSLGVETGSLSVNLDDPNAEWTVVSVGIVNLVNDNTVAVLLAGSDVNLNGTLNVTGEVRSNARIDIGGTGVVNILTAAEPFRFNGGNNTNDPNTIAGGTINGPGLLGADGTRALHGFGTINAAIDFDGTANLKADDGTLSITPVGAIIDVNQLGTNDADGILEILNAWNTNATATVLLNGGELRGAAVTNDGAAGINGKGLITASIINNTRIDAEGGATLTLQNQTPANLDGAGAGSLNAISGNLTVVYAVNTAVNFSGTVSADAGQEFFGDLTLWTFAAGSTLDLNGGTFRSNRSTVINGTVDAAAGPDSTISNPILARFGSTSATTLAGNLRLDGAPEIQAGATFTGGGSLINTAGTKLTLVDGADVDVLLQNEGTLVLGSSAGQTQGLDFQQTATGEWDVELGGTGINDYDRMTLTGLAAVDGTLQLSLIGGYVPTLADPLLTILSASSVSGTFDVVTQPLTMPPTLMFDVIYNAGNIQLDVISILPGDYNRSGSVDAADYPLWRKTLGSVVIPFSGADGDGDGMIDNDDYDVWKAHFGQVAGSGSAAAQSAVVPEPDAILLTVGAIVGLWLAGSRGEKPVG